MLGKAGYTGVTDDEIVNKWFDDPRKGIVLETMIQDVFDELKAQQDNRNPSKKKQH